LPKEWFLKRATSLPWPRWVGKKYDYHNTATPDSRERENREKKHGKLGLPHIEVEAAGGSTIRARSQKHRFVGVFPEFLPIPLELSP
jgi:hypothetical protein